MQGTGEQKAMEGKAALEELVEDHASQVLHGVYEQGYYEGWGNNRNLGSASQAHNVSFRHGGSNPSRTGPKAPSSVLSALNIIKRIQSLEIT